MNRKHDVLYASVSLTLALAASPAAHAALGALHASVDSDQSEMRAMRQTEPHGTYKVERLVLANGAYVQEYVNAGGTVFAVSWHGSAMPNLRQLLGSYAERASDGVHAYHQLHGMHGTAVVSSSDFALQTNGRMGAYWGRAWLPAQLPAGVGTAEIQ
jgi:hypothetical protein